jgi:hypothetical protein
MVQSALAERVAAYDKLRAQAQLSEACHEETKASLKQDIRELRLGWQEDAKRLVGRVEELQHVRLGRTAVHNEYRHD